MSMDRDYQYRSADIALRFEVIRNRVSVTQGTATVRINGEDVITFGDEIEIIRPGEKYYGPIIGGWASKKDDARFIRGLLFHTYDDYYHYSDKVKEIINRLCETDYPGTVKS